MAYHIYELKPTIGGVDEFKLVHTDDGDDMATIIDAFLKRIGVADNRTIHECVSDHYEIIYRLPDGNDGDDFAEYGDYTDCWHICHDDITPTRN